VVKRKSTKRREKRRIRIIEEGVLALRGGEKSITGKELVDTRGGDSKGAMKKGYWEE